MINHKPIIIDNIVNYSEDNSLVEEVRVEEVLQYCNDEPLKKDNIDIVATFKGVSITREMIDNDYIVCENTMEIYKDNKDASYKMGVNATSIKKCCNGSSKSAGKDDDGNKLIWYYVKDLIEKCTE